MKYVAQEEKFGCAIACMAMILGNTYQETKALLPDNRGFGNKNGLTSHDYISFLYKFGYIGMTVHACESHSQVIRKPKDWIKPLAGINIVSVINEHGLHAILWVDGKIYDPNDIRNYLKIEDYNVQGITGFWKQGVKTEAASWLFDIPDFTEAGRDEVAKLAIEAAGIPLMYAFKQLKLSDRITGQLLGNNGEEFELIFRKVDPLI